MRIGRGVVGMGALLSALACYRPHPLAAGVSPSEGTRLVLQVNDIGRAELGRTMGPEIDRISGRLVAREVAGYRIAVEEVRRLRGEVQVWAGERILVADPQVRTVSELRFDRMRTTLVASAGVGGFAFLVTRGLFGFSLGGTDPVPTDSGSLLRVFVP